VNGRNYVGFAFHGFPHSPTACVIQRDRAPREEIYDEEEIKIYNIVHFDDRHHESRQWSHFIIIICDRRKQFTKAAARYYNDR